MLYYYNIKNEKIFNQVFYSKSRCTALLRDMPKVLEMGRCSPGWASLNGNIEYNLAGIKQNKEF